ncbi:MAG: 3-isopropylmalate dehydratase small subunit [Planctomycetota bacterium]|nr:3-isopropylmalate dehydratase small subunit [Planctomycetota bacterium]
MPSFGGPVLFLDRSDINTDEIIPAKYLVEVKKEALKPHLLEDLKLPGFSPSAPAVRQARVIVTRRNFGCGSSREHAVWVLEVNEIRTVIAESFARIFRSNMFNCGLLAIELPPAEIEALFRLADQPVACAVDLANKELLFSRQGQELRRSRFALNAFDEALVRAGGWVEFADQRY